MIYTVGQTELYEKLFKENPEVKKKGRFGVKGEIDYYPGGSVWKEKEEAERYLLRNNITNYSVYGVDAEWYHDIIIDDSGNFEYFSLKEDKPLIKL